MQASSDDWTKILKVLRLIDFEGLVTAVAVDPIPTSWTSENVNPSTSNPLLALPPPSTTAKASAVASAVDSPVGWAELPKFDLLSSDDDADEPRSSAAATTTPTTTMPPIAAQPDDQLDDFGPTLRFAPEMRGSSLTTPTFSDCVEGIEELLTTTPLAAGHHAIVNYSRPPSKGRGKKAGKNNGSGKDKGAVANTGKDKGRGTTKGETGQGKTPSKTPKVSGCIAHIHIYLHGAF